MFDPAVDQLSIRQWIPGDVWPSPVYLGNAPIAYFGTYYHATQIPNRNCVMAFYESPGYSHKGNQLSTTAHAKQGNLGMTTGAAPVSGIYTGIPSGCTGGGPYS